jgi:AcrR family transcriptional regulator
MAVNEGLRETKKRQTRAAIAAVALDLFSARGFEGVTVAEVARAANVSEKTVFNYFPAKEDLVFEHGQERRAALVEAVRARPPGSSLLEPFRWQTLAFLDQVEHDAVTSVVNLPRLIMSSKGLRDRLFLDWEREADVLVSIVAQQTGADADDLLPRVAVRALTWTHRLVYRAAYTRLLDGEDQRIVAADLREQAERAYAQLAAGLGDYELRR